MQFTFKNADENFRVRQLLESLAPTLCEKKVSRSLVAQRQKAKHRNVVSRRRRSPITRGLCRLRESGSTGLCREECSKIRGRNPQSRGCFVHHLPAHERIVHPRDSLGQSAREL